MGDLKEALLEMKGNDKDASARYVQYEGGIVRLKDFVCNMKSQQLAAGSFKCKFAKMEPTCGAAKQAEFSNVKIQVDDLEEYGFKPFLVKADTVVPGDYAEDLFRGTVTVSNGEREAKTTTRVFDREGGFFGFWGGNSPESTFDRVLDDEDMQMVKGNITASGASRLYAREADELTQNRVNFLTHNAHKTLNWWAKLLAPASAQ